MTSISSTGEPPDEPSAPDSDPSQEVPVQPLRARALRASAWLIGARPIGMVIQLARSLILTRLLFPEAFGLMALVGVIMQGVAMCSDVGVGASIIHSKRGDDPRFLLTAWTIGILRGGFLWLICCALAWPAATFYGEPKLLALLPVAGLSAIIGAFGTTAYSTHGRRLMLGRLTIINFCVQLLTLVVLTGAAWWFRSVWALVIGNLAGIILHVVAGHILLPSIRHRLCWDRAAVKELVHFGRWVFVSTLLAFFAMQMDKLVLGKLLTIELLGVYSIALVLANIPRDLVTGVSGTILFPGLAEKFRNDRQGLHHVIERTRGILLRVGLLLTVGMAAIAPAFFDFLYDPRYHEAGWIAQTLAIAVWMAILNSSTGYTLLALGDTRALALSNLINVVTTIAGSLLGFHVFGLPGFIIGYAAGTGAGEVMQGLFLRRHGAGVLRQDLMYTLVGVACVGAAAGLAGSAEASGFVLGSWGLTGIGLSVWAILAVAMLPRLKQELLPHVRIPYFSRLRENREAK